MIIQVTQKPEGLTPTNTEHVYNIYSERSDLTNFKYLVDVYLFPYNFIGTNKTKVARLKAKPNAEGRLIIDIQEVVQSLFEANIRVDNADYYLETDSKMWLGVPPSFDSHFTTKPQIFDAFSKANGGSDVREDETPYSADPGLRPYYHFGEYKIMIGEEYTGDDGVVVVNISDNPEDLNEQGYSNSWPIGTWPVTYPGIQYRNYTGSNSYSEQGVTIEWWNSDFTTLKGGTSFNNTEGTWETPTQPANDDKLTVISSYSGKTHYFEYRAGLEVPNPGWVEYQITEGFAGRYPFTDSRFMPESIYTWVGADNVLQREDLIYSNVNDGSKSHLYGWEKWVMLNEDDGFTPDPGPKHYGKFLNVGGKESTFIAPNETPEVEVNLRERTVYVGEPIMVSFFNGYLNSFYNKIRAMVVRYRKSYYPTNAFTTEVLHNIRDLGGGPLVDVDDTYPTEFNNEVEPVGVRLLHFTKNNIWNQWNANNPIEWIEVNTWAFSDDIATDSPYKYGERASEVFRYNVKDVNCFDTPVYFVFLNNNGVWDTFTFGARSQKTYKTNRSTYEQGANYNSTSYHRKSWQNKTNVYDQTTIIEVDADTEYLEEYDSRIVEDLIRSSEVYILQNSYPSEPSVVGGEQEENNNTLIPVKLLTNQVKEYNKQYQKLFQHSIKFQYDNITGYRNSL